MFHPLFYTELIISSKTKFITLILLEVCLVSCIYNARKSWLLNWVCARVLTAQSIISTNCLCVRFTVLQLINTAFSSPCCWIKGWTLGSESKEWTERERERLIRMRMCLKGCQGIYSSQVPLCVKNRRQSLCFKVKLLMVRTEQGDTDVLWSSFFDNVIYHLKVWKH